MPLSCSALAFRPAPKVDSTLVRLTFRAPAVAVEQRAALQHVVQAVFTRRRKTLANALKPIVPAGGVDPVLARAGLDGRRRPETLSVAEFIRLAGSL